MNYFYDPESYESKNKGDRPKRMSSNKVRAVIRALKENLNQSMTHLKEETGIQFPRKPSDKQLRSDDSDKEKDCIIQLSK